MAIRRREQKRAHLGEKVLLAQVVWLDASLSWSETEGCLTWGGTIPNAELLWKTQKRLYELRGVDLLQQQLERAKRWLSLTPTDLADWLVIEALCENELPFSPSALLAQQGKAALPHLQAQEQDSLLPEEARPLLALVKQACQQGAPLPRHPDLVARLGHDAPSLQALPLFTLTPQSLRRAVRQGMQPARLLELLDSVVALKAFACAGVDWSALPLESLPPALRLVRAFRMLETPGMDDALAPILALDSRAAWLELLERNIAVLWPEPELTVKKRLTGARRETALLEKAQKWRAHKHLTVERLHHLVVHSQSFALAEDVLRANSLAAVSVSVPDPALYPLLWALQKEFRRTDTTLAGVFQNYRSVREFRSDFGELLRVLRTLPIVAREAFFDAIASSAHSGSREDRRQLVRLAPKLALLVPLTSQEDWDSWDWRELFSILPTVPLGWLPGLVARLTASSRMSRLPVAVALAGDDEALFHKLYEEVLPLDLDWLPFHSAERFCKELPRFPELRPVLSEQLLKHPHRTMEQMAQLGEALRLGLDALQPLQTLQPLSVPYSEEWTEIEALLPENSDVLWCALQPVTPGMKRALSLPERLQREAAFLASHPDRARARLANLQARLAQPEHLRTQVVAELQACVVEQAQKLRFAALEAAIQEVYRARLQGLIGSRALSVEMTPDIMNAVLLSLDIEPNRRLLIRLLRAYCDGDTRWALRQKANWEFLQALEERGVDSVAWQSDWQERLCCDELADGWLQLQLETDPLAVLQMGNYFDTCLSFGGCNSYSTVANASDANKRVLYGRDGKGRIVARQLLALTIEDGLVGFHLYSTVDDPNTRLAIVKRVRAFVERFAVRCGLTLATEGTVPTLLATTWYDDGTVAWDSPEVSPKTKSPGRLACLSSGA